MDLSAADHPITRNDALESLGNPPSASQRKFAAAAGAATSSSSSDRSDSRHLPGAEALSPLRARPLKKPKFDDDEDEERGGADEVQPLQDELDDNVGAPMSLSGSMKDPQQYEQQHVGGDSPSGNSSSRSAGSNGGYRDSRSADRGEGFAAGGSGAAFESVGAEARGGYAGGEGLLYTATSPAISSSRPFPHDLHDTMYPYGQGIPPPEQNRDAGVYHEGRPTSGAETPCERSLSAEGGGGREKGLPPQSGVPARGLAVVSQPDQLTANVAPTSAALTTPAAGPFSSFHLGGDEAADPSALTPHVSWAKPEVSNLGREASGQVRGLPCFGSTSGGVTQHPGPSAGNWGVAVGTASSGRDSGAGSSSADPDISSLVRLGATMATDDDSGALVGNGESAAGREIGGNGVGNNASGSSGGGGGDKGGDTGGNVGGEESATRDGSGSSSSSNNEDGSGNGGVGGSGGVRDEGDGSESDSEGPECRVCRGGDEGGTRPLVHPCRCRGSIKYVHQDCLVEWLKSRQNSNSGGGGGGAGGGVGQGGGPDGRAGVDASVLQAQRCELCREKLVFKAKYRAGAPAQLSIAEFLRGALRRASPRIMDAFRGALNVQMWGIFVPIFYCVIFRIGVGLALLFAQELAAFVSGDGGLPPPGDGADALLSSGGVGTEQTTMLPGLDRIWWGSWLDLLGDWCGGVSLMIGVMCVGPPCVELAMEFVKVLKTIPIVIERWWTGTEDGNPTRPFVEGGNDGVAAPPARDEAERRDEGNDEALGVGLPALRNGPAAEAAEAAAGDGAAAGAAGQGGDAAERPRAEGWAGARRRDVGPGQDRRGVLGVLDKVERMLAGALEQLAAPPREEDLDGEALFLWGWPAVGTAASFLAFMGLLVFFAQTVPYSAFHACNGIVERSSFLSSPLSDEDFSAPHPFEPHLPSWNSVERASPAASAAFSLDLAGLSTRHSPSPFHRNASSKSPRLYDDPPNEGSADGIRGFPSGIGGSSAGKRGGVGTAGDDFVYPHIYALGRLGLGHVGGILGDTQLFESDHDRKGSNNSMYKRDIKAWKRLAESAPTARRMKLRVWLSDAQLKPSPPGRRAVPGVPLNDDSKAGSGISNKGDDNGGIRAKFEGVFSFFRPQRWGWRWSRRRSSSSKRISHQGKGSRSPRRARNGTRLKNVPRARNGPHAGRDGSSGGKNGPKNSPRSTVGRRDGGGYKGDSEDDDDDDDDGERSGVGEWWAALVIFVRGPVIPGTSGLRVGAVLCETVQGQCLLAVSLLALSLIYSIVRLRVILARSARRPRAPPFPEPTAQASAGGSQRTDGPPPVVIPPGDAMEADVPDRGHGELVPRAGGIDAGGGAVGVGGGLWIGGLGAGPRGEGMAGGMLERDGQMGLDLKVLTMGVLELFILPLWVGINVDLFSLSLMASTTETRVAWSAASPMYSFALHCVLAVFENLGYNLLMGNLTVRNLLCKKGAGSMAVGIVGCLAREIGRALKPNLLPPWLNKPAEQGLEEVLVRMTHDPFLQQVQGFLISMVAYPIALVIMVMVPTHCRAMLGPLLPSWVQGLTPIVLGIGEPTQGDRLGMDLVLFHFVLPVVMEHLKIRGPVRRAACWVLKVVCGVTGTGALLLHPALLAGRGAGANDPDDLDDINLPEPQPEPQPQPQPEPVPAIPPAIVADADPAAAAAADPNPFALPPPLQDELPVLAVIAPDSPGALDGDEDRGFGGLDDQDVGAVGEHDNDEDNADDVDDNEAVMHEGGRMGRGLERMRVLVACALVGLALAVLPASAVLVPLLQGRALFGALGLPLDDDLPPFVAGAISCSAAAWALSTLFKLQVAAGEHRRLVWKSLVIAGKWFVIGGLLVGALPALTGLLVHDALRGPLPPAEETAALSWGKIWALGLVCVKLWGRCVMAGAMGDEAWRGRLRRVRLNGIRGVNLKYTLIEVCLPLLDRVGQYYFWPHLINRFVLPMIVMEPRSLRLIQKGTPLVYLLCRALLAGALFAWRKIKALHDLIRDDEYLVGLELENMPPQGRAL